MIAMSSNSVPPPPPCGSAVPGASDGRTFKQVGRAKIEMAAEHLPAWKDVLQRVKLPTAVVVIDFETYFDSAYSLRRTRWSTIEYVRDKRFEALGVSILDMNQPFKDYEKEARWYTHDRIREGLSLLQQQYGCHLENCTVVMQNARFDAAILRHHYGIAPKHLIDTLGLARHWNSRTKNDLDTLAATFDLPAKGDTLKFKGWTHRTRFVPKKGRRKRGQAPELETAPKMTPEQDRELGDYANNDTAREWEVFMLLLPRLSRPEVELPLIQGTLDLFLKPELNVDPLRAEEIIAGMEGRMDEAVEAAGMTLTQLRGRYFDEAVDEWITEYGPVTHPDQAPVHPGEFRKPEKVHGWKLATANDDWQRKALLQHPDDRVRLAMEAKVAVHSWPNHIKRVRRIVNQAAANDGVLPVPLKYHGAHTGRWSGDERINLQNLGERNPEPLIRAVRELLVAQPDHQLVIADLSAIEGRGVGWIADEQGLLQDFRDQDADPDAIEDVYTKFASKVLGERIVHPGKAGLKGEEAKYHKWGRGVVGKIGVLGGGYGMGGEKAQGLGEGLDLPMAKRIIGTYRDDNPAIVQFWHDIEAAFIYTYKYHEAVQLRHGLRTEHRPDCDVVIVLPNGRELKYHEVRLRPGKYGRDAIGVYNANERKWGHVWGGHLTENIVQGFCRDIMGEAWLRCGDRGAHVVLHVHDELVAHALTSRAPATLSTLIEELTRPVVWAPGFPLAAEGCITPRYGGH